MNWQKVGHNVRNHTSQLQVHKPFTTSLLWHLGDVVAKVLWAYTGGGRQMLKVRFCPCCGNRVTEPIPQQGHTHYFCINCSKCGQVSNVWLKTEINLGEVGKCLK